MVLFVYPICVPETDPSKYAFLIVSQNPMRNVAQWNSEYNSFLMLTDMSSQWLAWKAPMVLAMISFIIMTIAACLADPKTTSAGKLGDILSGIAVISCLLYGYGSFVWVAASSTTLIGDSDDPKDNFDSSNTQEVILVIVLVCAFLALLMVLLIFSYYVVVMIKERVSSLKLFSKKRCGKKDLELGEADGASGPQSCVPIMMKDVDHDEPV